MALTTLDPNTALVVIDLQKGVVGLPPAGQMAAVIERSVALLDAFRRRGLPVVLVNVDGVPPGRTERVFAMRDLPPDFADLIPELDRQPTDHLVTKRTRGAFTGTDLEAWLKGRGVTQIVLVGVATSAGVESTARHAHELGFNVTLAIDAMTDRNPDMHGHSVTHIFPGIGETGNTEDILGLLDQHFPEKARA